MSFRRATTLLALLFLLFPGIANAAISFVGSCTGTTSCTMPSHQSGDVCVGFTFRDGNVNAPTVPTGSGWVSYDTTVGTSSNGSAVGYIIADSASEVSGTWTSATSLIITCWRGVDNTTPLGTTPSPNSSNVADVTYLHPTFDVTDGTSWALACAGHRSADTTLDADASVPTDFSTTNKITNTDATDETVCFNTNTGVTGTTDSTISVGGTASGWRTIEVELRAAAAVTDTPYDPFGVQGFFGL